MRKLILLFLSVAYLQAAFAQQQVQFTHFMYNQQATNPAYVGSQGHPLLTLLYRGQWLGFEGAPQSQVLSFAMPFLDDRLGFGVLASHQRAGISDNWYANIAYSYKIPLNEQLSIRAGLQAALKFYQLDFEDPSNVIFDPDDPSVADGMQVNQARGDVGVGLFLQHPNFYVGLSAPHILPNSIGFNDEVMTTAKESLHAYGIVGADFPVSDMISFQPSVQVNYVQGAPFGADVNFTMAWTDLLRIGASYRTGGNGFGESVDLLLYYQLSYQLGLGIAYDFTISELMNYNTGTFEAMIRYDIRQPEVIEDQEAKPRYF